MTLADRVAVVVLDIASSTLVSVDADLARGDEEAALGFAYADRARYAVHVLAFRDGANGDARSAVLSVNSSVGFDEMGLPVLVTARDRIAALAEGARASADGSRDGGERAGARRRWRSRRRQRRADQAAARPERTAPWAVMVATKSRPIPPDDLNG